MRFINIVVMMLFIFTINFSCTIFTLSDEYNTLFCNNEDWKNPKSRIWFEPKAKKDYYSCAFVGFNNQWAQGGVNTEGLAFDWVAGYKGKIDKKAMQKNVRGNPSEKMLKTCRNIEEAIEFYKDHFESAFSYARIMIADSSGSSVIIGANNGELFYEKSNSPTGIGYAHEKVKSIISSKPSISTAKLIAKIAEQKGKYGTKYHNFFDLKNGDIYILTSGKDKRLVKLNLEEELVKGKHYYNIPKIHVEIEKRLKKNNKFKEIIKWFF